jgi:hypothetical protein
MLPDQLSFTSIHHKTPSITAPRPAASHELAGRRVGDPCTVALLAAETNTLTAHEWKRNARRKNRAETNRSTDIYVGLSLAA